MVTPEPQKNNAKAAKLERKTDNVVSIIDHKLHQSTMKAPVREADRIDLYKVARMIEVSSVRSRSYELVGLANKLSSLGWCLLAGGGLAMIFELPLIAFPSFALTTGLFFSSLAIRDHANHLSKR